MFNYKKVQNIGVNDADYEVAPIVDGKQNICPFYDRWKSMIARCYSGRNTAYDNVTVCDDWLIFSNFKSWMIKQNWKGLELDKDVIRPGNKQYGPETCCFVSQELNKLLPDIDQSKGFYYSKEKKKYMSRCWVNGKRKFIGYFTTVQEARIAYIQFKSEQLKKYIQSENDERIQNGLMLHLKGLNNVSS